MSDLVFNPHCWFSHMKAHIKIILETFWYLLSFPSTIHLSLRISPIWSKFLSISVVMFLLQFNSLHRKASTDALWDAEQASRGWVNRCSLSYGNIKYSNSLHRLLKIEVHLVNTGMLAWIPSETLNRLLGGGWLGAHSAVTVQFVKYTGMSAWNNLKTLWEDGQTSKTVII